jgi:hypothetical protein
MDEDEVLAKFAKIISDDPPTVCQYCIYQKALNKSMGWHRDNFECKDFNNLAYMDVELNQGGKWCGVENSQVKGSAYFAS